MKDKRNIDMEIIFCLFSCFSYDKLSNAFLEIIYQILFGHFLLPLITEAI